MLQEDPARPGACLPNVGVTATFRLREGDACPGRADSPRRFPVVTDLQHQGPSLTGPRATGGGTEPRRDAGGFWRDVGSPGWRPMKGVSVTGD